MADQPDAPGTGRRRWAWLTELALPVLLGAAFVTPICLEQVRETDAGWHLAVGRLIAQSGIPRTNALSWTTPNEPWYATSWLYDWLSFEIISAGGVRGLQLFTLGLVLGTLLLLAIACRAVDRRRGAWLVPATALLLVPRITERPHVATWVVLAGVLALCLIARKQGWRWRAACLPLIVFGANLHSGAVFPAAVLVIFCVESAWLERRWGREGALAALGCLALMANPGAAFNIRYVIEHLAVQDVIKLAEFDAPTLKRAPTFYVSLLLALVSAWAVRRRSPAYLVLTLVFGALGLYALRLVYEFAIVAAPVLTGGLVSIRSVRPRLEVVVLASGLLALTAARERAVDRVKFGNSFDAAVLPVDAARFIQSEHLDGRAFNAFVDGGYLEYAVPGFKAFQDARVQAFPPGLFKEEEEAEDTKSPEVWQAYLKSKDVEWVIAPRRKNVLGGWHRMRGPDWALVYWDATSEIYFRRDVPRLAARLGELEYHFFRPDLAPAVVNRLSPEEVATYEREATRADAWQRDNADAATAHCLALRKLHAPAAAAACDRATNLCDDGQLRLLQEALGIDVAATKG